MSSWTFALGLPGSDHAFEPATAFVTLVEAGMVFDSECYVVRLAEDGVVATVREQPLRVPGELLARIRAGEELQVSCRNKHVNLVIETIRARTFRCVVLGWPSRLMSSAPPGTFEHLVVAACKAAGSRKMILVADPPDEWLGQIEATDDGYIVDTQTARGPILNDVVIYDLVDGGRRSNPGTRERIVIIEN